MFKVYSKMHGLPYLFKTLANHIVALEHENKISTIDTEIDPNKMEEGSDSVSNKVSINWNFFFF